MLNLLFRAKIAVVGDGQQLEPMRDYKYLAMRPNYRAQACAHVKYSPKR